MIPNSFYVSGQTLYAWLEDGSDPKNSVMRAAPGHVISLHDCHYSASARPPRCRKTIPACTES
jgi:hypothetical protein